MDIVIILLTSINLIGLVIGLYYLFTKKAKGSGDLTETNIRLKDLSDIVYALENKMVKSLDANSKNNLVEIIKELNEASESNSKKEKERYITLEQQLKSGVKELQELIEKKLEEINGKVNERLEKGFLEANKTFKDVMESIVRIEEAKKKMDDLTMHVVDLQSILKNNQTRGQFGEFQLYQILDAVFEGKKELYQTQYRFKNEGKEVIVDAAIFMSDKDKTICIDSKFPFVSYHKLISCTDPVEKNELLKSFKKEVKGNIKSISQKYIIPGQTYGQAFMFLPSDGILAMIHQDAPEIISEAQSNCVMLTSPATLLPTLAAIRTININVERAKQVEIIQKHLEKLGGSFKKFGEDWAKFSRNLKTAFATSGALDNRFKAITKEFLSINKGYILEELDEDDNLETIDDESLIS